MIKDESLAYLFAEIAKNRAQESEDMIRMDRHFQLGYTNALLHCGVIDYDQHLRLCKLIMNAAQHAINEARY